MATRDELLRLASAILSASGGGPLVRVVIEGPGTWIELDPQAEPGDAAPDLPEMQRRLLARINHEAQSAKAVARAAGYTWGSHVYEALRGLERRGLIRKAPGGGYCRG